MYVILNVINNLKVLTAPFLPFSAQKLHELLGYEGDLSLERWASVTLPAGRVIDPSPTPLFDKLDDANIAEENQRLGQPWQDPEGKISEDKRQESIVIFENRIRTRDELGEDWR